MRRLVGSLVLLGALAVLVGSEGRAEPTASLASNVIDFALQPKNDNGQLVCGLFVKKGWLKTPVIPAWARINNRRATCVFANVPPGTYAISAYHDENRNGKLDTNAMGMPTEEYCASRNARNTYTGPDFDDAKFEYRGGRVRMTATLK